MLMVTPYSARLMGAFLAVALLGLSPSMAQQVGLSATRDVSLQREVAHVIDRGSDWLLGKQGHEGHWGGSDPVRLTALALMALVGDPVEDHAARKRPVIAVASTYLWEQILPSSGPEPVKDQKRDLSRASSALLALSMTSLESRPNAWYQVRNELIQQIKADPDRGLVLDEGTLIALQALYFSRHLVAVEAQSDTWMMGVVKPLFQNTASVEGVVTGETAHPSWQQIGQRLKLASFLGWDHSYPQVDRLRQRLDATDWLKEGDTRDFAAWLHRVHHIAQPLVWMRVEPEPSEESVATSWRQEVILQLMDKQLPQGGWGPLTESSKPEATVELTSMAVMILCLLYPGL